MPLEIGQHVVELAEGTLAFHLIAEARAARARVAFVGRDARVLVLDHAGDRAKRSVGDVPSDRATELPRGDPPRLAVLARRDDRRLGRAELHVQVIAESIELADDLGGDVILAAAAIIEHAPEGVAPATLADTLGQLLENADRLGDRLDRRPRLGLATAIAPLVHGALDPVTLDEAVLAAPGFEAARTHGLHLGIPHAGEISTDDIAGRLQHPLFNEQRLGIEARPPGKPRVRIVGDGRVHAAGLDAKRDNGVVHDRLPIPREQDVGPWIGLRVNADVHVDQGGVDRRCRCSAGGIGADNTVVSCRPDRHASTTGAELVEVGDKPVTAPPQTHCLGEAPILGDQLRLPMLKSVELSAGGQDVG